jgi:hypothetical protein
MAIPLEYIHGATCINSAVKKMSFGWTTAIELKTRMIVKIIMKLKFSLRTLILEFLALV